MRPIVHLALLAAAVLGTAPALAASAPAETTQVVQQRLRDGSILLTDRPAAGATTERSWQLPPENPAAERRRALDVSAEAQAVSERIQRLLEQQRRAEQESDRLRLARLELERQNDRDRAAFDDDHAWTDGVVLFAPERRLARAMRGRTATIAWAITIARAHRTWRGARCRSSPIEGSATGRHSTRYALPAAPARRRPTPC
jgi:hypothetical protein